jgi:diguanylate cyclase (GGDEF)-like protein
MSHVASPEPRLALADRLQDEVLKVERRLFEAALDGAGVGALTDIVIVGLAASGALCRLTASSEDGSPDVARHSAEFPARFAERIRENLIEDPLASSIAAPIVSLDVKQETRWRQHAALCLVNGLKGFVVEPLILDSNRAGAIAFYFSSSKTERDPEVATLRGLAKSLCLALRARRSRQNQRAADDALNSLSGAIPGVVYQRLVTPAGDIRYTYISDGSREMFGVEPERILTDPEALFQHYDVEYRRTFRTKLIEASRAMTKWDVEATIRLPDGRIRFTHAIARPRKLADGSVLWTGVILDAGRIKEAESAAAAAEANTRHAIVESLNQGMLLFDSSDRLVIANSHFATLYPRLGRIVAPGLTYEDFIEAENGLLLEAGLLGVDELEERNARLLNREKRTSITERKHADDKWVMVTETYDPAKGSAILYTDVSELKQRERRIHHLAYHDALTGLHNRTSFRQRLSDALDRTRIEGTATAVLCLDLDGFKFVNDTLGHPAGDRLLMEVAHRLKSVVRASDMVARLGGDEFAIVVDGLPSAEYATSLSWRLLDVIGQPYDIDGHQVVSTTSIGIAVAQQGDGIAADVLIKNSDMALYRAKFDGRNAFRFFEPDMDARAQQRRSLEHDLRKAVECDELELFYQPLVDVYTEEVTCMEALLRWRHPVRGLVPPTEFISLAEETGLIIEIGAWVMHRACMDAAQWPDSIRIAVNVSPAQFLKRDLIDVVASALRESGVRANRLEVEITESLLLRDTATNLSTLMELKALGVRISMDDFGTGYSSLANLRSFPFDKIKIDKSFVEGIDRNADSSAIVRAVLNLGRGLGMTTTAEGVETRDQLAYLRSEGCLEVQGFFFSEPMPFDQVARYLVVGNERPRIRWKPVSSRD